MKILSALLIVGLLASVGCMKSEEKQTRQLLLPTEQAAPPAEQAAPPAEAPAEQVRRTSSCRTTLIDWQEFWLLSQTKKALMRGLFDRAKNWPSFEFLGDCDRFLVGVHK